MLTGLRALIWAEAIISAAHRDRDGSLHGHSWLVRAYWKPGQCVVGKQEELTSYLSIFDHHELAPEYSWAEALGQAICKGLDCEAVEISRPLERVGAVVYKESDDATG